MNEKHHVVVVGGGLGGLVAAEILDRYKLDVLVLDENLQAGGQLLRGSPSGPIEKRRFEPDRLKRFGMGLVDRIERKRIPIRQRTQVLGVYPEHRLLIEDEHGEIRELSADFIICATGAREKYLPFKGWTLPGIMSSGAAQILMKESGMLPAEEILIGGGGPLMLVLASEILFNGGRVTAVLDRTSVRDKIGVWPLLPRHWLKILEGARYLSKLLSARVPIGQGIRIIEAGGDRFLEEVVTAKVDGRGRIIPGTESVRQAEALAYGCGFSPNIELPQQAGCKIEFDRDKGGWVVSVDEALETSAPCIYAVGEITGIAGGKKSYIEGRIAAWSILDRLGLVENSRYRSTLAILRKQRGHQMEYGRFLNNLNHIPAEAYDSISDETIICRCEEVTMGDIRRQISNGFTTMGAIKKASRCTMGHCQGRICGPIVFDILSAKTRQPPESIGYTTARAPVKAVRLGSMAEMTLPD